MEQIGLKAVLDDADFQAGLKRFDAGTKKMATSADNVGKAIGDVGNVMGGALVVGLTAAAGALAGFIKVSQMVLETTLQWGETLDKLGDQFGMNARDAGKWAATFKHFGVPVEEAAQQINFFTRGLAETYKIGKKGEMTLTPFGEALRKLGINGIDPVTKKTKDFNKIMPEVLNGFAKLKPGVDASALAMDLFGARGGTKFLDFLREGNKALPEMEQFLKDTGLAMSDDMVSAVESFGRAQNDLNMRLDGFKNTIGQAILPYITTLVDKLNKEVMPAITKWAMEVIPVAIKKMEEIGQAVYKAWIETISPALNDWRTFMVKQIIPAIQDLYDKMKEFDPLVRQWQNLITDIRQSLESLNVSLDNTGQKFDWLAFIVNGAMENIKSINQTAMNAIHSAQSAILAAMQGDWITFGDALSGIIFNAFANMIPMAIRNSFDWIRSAVWDIGVAIGNEILNAMRAGMNWNPVPARAMGGPVAGGSPYLVGERGPELFVPQQTGVVIPNMLTRSITNNYGGARSVSININAPVYGVNDLQTAIAGALNRYDRGL